MSQETKSITAAKNLLINSLHWSKSYADNFIRINLRGDIPILRDTNHGAKFILGATRMYVNGELNNGESISQLNTVLKYIASDAHINEYDRNLNGESLQTLVDRFSQNVTDDLEKDKEEVSRLKLTPNESYTVVRIDSFEDAKKYKDYTSWCITHDKSMLDSYTNNGMAQFYFCFRNGFENERVVKEPNYPLDSYGLSLVVVCVDENGGLKTCTCRWNHDNGGNDSILNTKQISELIGRNFYEVFKPNNKWKDALEIAMKRLKNGEDIKDIFDMASNYYNYKKIRLCGKYNLIDKQGNILFKQWLDYITPFIDNYTKIELNERCNLMDRQGRVLFKQWYKRIFGFCDGYVIVKLNNKYNFIDTQENSLSKQWFDYVDNFLNEFARVKLNGRWNFINKEGKLLSEQWFDDVRNFDEGYAGVFLNNEPWFLDTNGELTKKPVGDNWITISVDENGDKVDEDGDKIFSKEWLNKIYNGNIPNFPFLSELK